MILVGLGVGLLWRAFAPRIEIIRVDQGYVYANSEPEQAVAADGWFLFLGLGAGLLLGVLAWVLLRRYRGIAVLIGLVLGSVVGAWLGWWLGVQLDRHAFDAAAASVPIGGHLRAPLSLGMTGLDHKHLWPPKVTGVVLAQALAAAVGYTTLAGFSADPLLRPASQRTTDDLAALLPAAPVPVPPPVPSPSPLPGPPPVPAPPDEPQAVRSEPPPSSGPDGPAGPPRWPAPPGSG
jgi:hypothetical protein